MRTALSFASSANCPNEKMSESQPEASVVCLWMLQTRNGSIIILDVTLFPELYCDGPFWLQRWKNIHVKIQTEVLKFWSNFTKAAIDSTYYFPLLWCIIGTSCTDLKTGPGLNKSRGLHEDIVIIIPTFHIYSRYHNFCNTIHKKQAFMSLKIWNIYKEKLDPGVRKKTWR